MYCPKCKSEFKAGITVCPNCKIDLIEELVSENEELKEIVTLYSKEMVEKIISYLEHVNIKATVTEKNVPVTEVPEEVINISFTEEELENLTEESTVLSYVISVPAKLQKAAAAEINTILSVEARKYAEEHPEELLKKMAEPAPKKAKQYVSQKDRAAEYKSSGVMFIVMGILIGVFVLGIVLKLIPLSLAPISMILLGIMAVACVLSGVLSINKSKKIALTVADEESVVDKVKAFLNDNFKDIDLEKFKVNGVSDEIAFLNMTEFVKNKTMEAFPDSDEDFLDQMIDEFINGLDM